VQVAGDDASRTMRAEEKYWWYPSSQQESWSATKEKRCNSRGYHPPRVPSHVRVHRQKKLKKRLLSKKTHEEEQKQKQKKQRQRQAEQTHSGR